VTSERQIAANRANAQHSTGPKTAAGKAAVRLNPCRHGLFAGDVVLPEENAEEFEELWNQTRANLSPEGPIEEFLADRIVSAMWRRRRLERAETAWFHSRIHALKADHLAKQVASFEEHSFDNLPMSRPEITDKAAHRQASEALGRATHERDRDEVLLGRVIDADPKEGDVLAKFARYERSLDRSFFHALEQLHRIQNNRRKRAPIPVSDAITVDTEGTE
jgi:hypothetical protein